MIFDDIFELTLVEDIECSSVNYISKRNLALLNILCNSIFSMYQKMLWEKRFFAGVWGRISLHNVFFQVSALVSTRHQNWRWFARNYFLVATLTTFVNSTTSPISSNVSSNALKTIFRSSSPLNMLTLQISATSTQTFYTSSIWLITMATTT